MEIKILVSTLLLAIFMQNCAPKKPEVVVRFFEEVAGEVAGEQIPQPIHGQKSVHAFETVIYERIDELFIGYPLQMSVSKDDLFIGDSFEPMIIHYNLKDKKTDRFLSKGRGPQETSPPVILFANPFGDNKLYRYSNVAFDLGFYPLDSLSVFVPLYKLPLYSSVIPYEKDRFLGTGMFKDEYRYKVLNAEGIVIGSFGTYPDFLDGENQIPLDARAMFHQVRFANSYRMKKLVAASNYVLDIIDYSLDITHNSITRILLAPYNYEYESGSYIYAQEKKGIVKGAFSIACDATYIYLLFDPGIVGQKNNEVKKEIWILDWNGKSVKKLILDADVKEITADPFSNDHSIFGLAYEIHGDDEHYKIVKIKL